MKRPFRRSNYAPTVTVVILLFLAGASCVYLIRQTAAAWERCEIKQGGTYYCGYKSTCVCFARGTVLP